MNISYETCMALKVHGFPHNPGGRRYTEVYEQKEMTTFLSQDLSASMAVYIPELSELIHACGTAFLKLERSKDEWVCVSREIYSCESTPEESVAKLWIALQKNTKSRLIKKVL